MNPDQKKSLQTRMAARFEVKELESPVVQKEISDALEAIQGVCDVHIEQGAVHITYDPLQTSEMQLKQAVEKRHHPISNAETGPETPHPDLPPRENRQSRPG